MARFLGFNQMIESNAKNVGLKYPFGVDSQTGFKTNLNTEDQNISNLLYYLSIQKGEVPFRPLLGTSILSKVFEASTEEVVEQIRLELLEEIRVNLPKVRVSDISFFRDLDRNSISIQLTVLKHNGTEQSVSFGINELGQVVFTE